MPIIVAGKLLLKPHSRDEFIAESITAIELARQHSACEDFSVSPDPIDQDRVNVFEKWISRNELEQFRESGPAKDIFSLVLSFDVKEYETET